ncbi:caffeine-induced protein 16 [Phtheirospermum japonicum]|uniref:Caffeine-induced protein 16 n=1 Tax=Phtheirospermum japonicum TaxID=374723 RepID=A0A830B484_9LAMI|nr:caffeine-induced protein 16 [Phtheirospermum japonicum]
MWETGATVEPYGSFVSDLFTKWGDLDISIELLNGSHITSPGKKHKQSLLGEVLKALRKKGGFRRLQFISNARVPILKFETGYNISCDISVNNLSGQMKSKMLFWINQIDGRFHELVLLVKEWAKAHHIK